MKPATTAVVRRHLARPALLAVVVGALTLAGCSGADDEPKGPIASPSAVDLAPTARVEIARGIYKENDPGEPYEPLISAEEARCIGDAQVEEFGVERLIAIGVIDTKGIYRTRPMSTPAQDAEVWVKGLEGCLDLKDFALGVARAGVREVAPKAGGDNKAWEKARACLDDADPKAAHTVMLQSLTAKPKNDAPTLAFLGCVKVAYPAATS